jgi:2-C-methyl-D-erythritol 4-phosphate cytidylyltransferase
VTIATIEALVAQLATADAATVATPATDTMLSVADGAVTGVPDRTQLWHAQTPQGFRIATLRAAYVAMGSELQDFSDECGLVRRYLLKTRIAIVPGAPDNIKITEPGDLELAAGLLARRARVKNERYNE